MLFIILGSALLVGVADAVRLLDDTKVTLAAMSTNPSSQFHPIRPAIWITMPVFWLLMLLSPQVRRWSRTPPKDSPVPVSLVDLFYWVFAAALCTSLAIGLVGFARQRLDVGQTLAEMLARSKSAAQASPSPTKTP
jgi:hypothetical protein